MAFLMETVSALRRFRADHEIEPGAKPQATAEVADPGSRALLTAESETVRKLARWGSISVSAETPQMDGPAARLVLGKAVLHVPLAGLLDIDAERARLQKERAKHANEVERLESKLGDANFTERAPEDVVGLQRERLAGERDLIARLDEALQDLS